MGFEGLWGAEGLIGSAGLGCRKVRSHAARHGIEGSRTWGEDRFNMFLCNIGFWDFGVKRAVKQRR